jgi:hypothetical protein
MGMQLSLALLALLVVANAQMPCPFYRELSAQSPLLSGSDVFMMQNLLRRAMKAVPITGNYDAKTQAAVEAFQKANQLSATGVFDEDTASSLLENYLSDGYKDNGLVPNGVMYKVYVPVYKNRSIETTATLFAGNGTILLNFTARTQGQVNNDTGIALNELCDSGSTPTGLMSFDLNSPEPDPISYGPYPVNRAVQGLEGNAAMVISYIRDGILMHTGEWAGWNPSMPMPNSHGCIHAHPQDIKDVWDLLVSIGVEVRNNTFGKLPYPYPTQGILSIEQLD